MNSPKDIKTLLSFTIRGRVKFALLNEPRKNDSGMLYLNLAVKKKDFDFLEDYIRSTVSLSPLKMKHDLIIPHKANEQGHSILFFKRKVRDATDRIVIENQKGEEFKDKILTGYDLSVTAEVNYKETGPNNIQLGFKLTKIVFHRALFPTKDQNKGRERSWASSGHNRPDVKKDKYQSIDPKYNSTEGDLV